MRVLVVAVLVLCQAAAPLSAVPRKLPPIQSERFARDLHDKNVDHVLTLYTDRAVFIEPGGKTHKGLDEIRKLYDRMTTAFDSDLHLTMTSFEQTRTFGIEHGTFTETLRAKATGATRNIIGTYVFLHEKQTDGSWLIARQKWTEAH